MRRSSGRPVRHHQHQVKAIGNVPSVHWEPQIVTNQGAAAESLKLCSQGRLTRRVVLMLSRHSKQVALVVKLNIACRCYPDKAVREADLRVNHD